MSSSPATAAILALSRFCSCRSDVSDFRNPPSRPIVDPGGDRP